MNPSSRPLFGKSYAAGFWLCALLVSMPLSALPLLEELPTLDTLRNRLELTQQQETQLQPLFEKRKLELHQTKSLLEQATSEQQRRAVLRDAEHAGDAFSHQVERFLTPSQQYEWRDLCSELREKAKERIEEESEAR